LDIAYWLHQRELQTILGGKGMKNYRIVCYWPSEVWAVQERISTDWMEVHRCVGKKQNGYEEAKNWLKDNDK
jgi:hypothetical protein